MLIADGLVEDLCSASYSAVICIIYLEIMLSLIGGAAKQDHSKWGEVVFGFTPQNRSH